MNLGHWCSKDHTREVALRIYANQTSGQQCQCPNFTSTHLSIILTVFRFLNVKALGAFNQEKVLDGAFSAIINLKLCEGLFPALIDTPQKVLALQQRIMETKALQWGKIITTSSNRNPLLKLIWLLDFPIVLSYLHRLPPTGWHISLALTSATAG